MSKPGKVNPIIKGLEQGSAVDFLFIKDLICCSDQTAELIQCMTYNETHSSEKVSLLQQFYIFIENYANHYITINYCMKVFICYT